jgi:hypothetical protein
MERPACYNRRMTETKVPIGVNNIIIVIKPPGYCIVAKADIRKCADHVVAL